MASPVKLKLLNGASRINCSFEPMIPGEIQERYVKLTEEYKKLHGRQIKLRAEFADFFEQGGKLAKKALSAGEAYLEIKKEFKGPEIQLQEMESKLLEMGEKSKSFMPGLREFIDDNVKLLDKIHSFQHVIKDAGEALIKGKTTKRQMSKVMDKLEKGFGNIKANYEQCREALDEREAALKEMAAVHEGLEN